VGLDVTVCGGACRRRAGGRFVGLRFVVAFCFAGRRLAARRGRFDRAIVGRRYQTIWSAFRCGGWGSVVAVALQIPGVDG
jgi:hypothetical protein